MIGAIFSLEVLVVVPIRYDVLLASFIAGFSGIEYTYFNINFIQPIELNLFLIFQVILDGIFFGFIYYVTITTLKSISRIIKKILAMKKSDFFKIEPGENISEAKVAVEDSSMEQFHSIRERI